MNFVTAVPYFVILIGILIFVHEGGHFLFAKLFKVKVHVFSLGFGPKLLGFRRGETLYKISAVPIGGYVKMLGEDPTEVLQPEDKGRAFGDKPRWQRLLIIIGGPVTNLIFPLFLYFGVGLTISEIYPAEIGFVIPGQPADQVGLRPGDQIISIDGQDVHRFDELISIVGPRHGQEIQIQFRRDDQILTRGIVPEATQVPIIPGFDEMETLGLIGVYNTYFPSVVAVADPASPAGKSGLKSFDWVAKVDGEPVTRLVDLGNRIVAAAGGSVVLEVKTFKKDNSPPFNSVDDLYEKSNRSVTLNVPSGVSSLADMGIENTKDFVAYVTPDGAAEKIGLQCGDKLVSLDGIEYTAGKIYQAIGKKPDQVSVLGWNRQGQPMESQFRPTFIPAGEDGGLTAERDRYDKGFWGFMAPTVLPDALENTERMRTAFDYSLGKTWEGLRLTVIGMKLLVQGRVSLRSLGGPIMIGQLAGQAGKRSATDFFWIMGIISLNLGLLNLLPIPVLDGGQIVFIGIEAVTRRPLSGVLKERIMLVGVVMVLFLMVFTTWNDIARLLVG